MNSLFSTSRQSASSGWARSAQHGSEVADACGGRENALSPLWSPNDESAFYRTACGTAGIGIVNHLRASRLLGPVSCLLCDPSPRLRVRGNQRACLKMQGSVERELNWDGSRPLPEFWGDFRGGREPEIQTVGWGRGPVRTEDA